jgi:hypothetical protein
MNNKKVFPLKYAAKLLLYFGIAKGKKDFNTSVSNTTSHRCSVAFAYFHETECAGEVF